MKMMSCPHCQSPIRLKLFFGNAHMTCPQCKREYQLSAQSMKRRMLEPFVSVGFAVATSLIFLKGQTIDVKTVYILGVSFFLAAMLDYFMVRLHILAYEEKVGR